MTLIRIDEELVREYEEFSAGLESLRPSLQGFHAACDSLALVVSEGFEYEPESLSSTSAWLGLLRAQVAARAMLTAADAVESLNARAVLRVALSTRSLLETAAFAAHHARQLVSERQTDPLEELTALLKRARPNESADIVGKFLGLPLKEQVAWLRDAYGGETTALKKLIADMSGALSSSASPTEMFARLKKAVHGGSIDLNRMLEGLYPGTDIGYDRKEGPTPDVRADSIMAMIDDLGLRVSPWLKKGTGAVHFDYAWLSNLCHPSAASHLLFLWPTNRPGGRRVEATPPPWTIFTHMVRIVPCLRYSADTVVQALAELEQARRLSGA